MTASSAIRIAPLERSTESRQRLGAIANNVDLSHLTNADFNLLKEAVCDHQVLVLKNQAKMTPKEQYELTQRFDPAAQAYGHGKNHNNAEAAKASILHPDLKTITHRRLKHPHHQTFYRDVVPKEDDLKATRFFRWHIDAELYDLNPPRVTTLMAVNVPKGATQICRHDEGSSEELEVPLGTTAFVNGETMYDILSDEDKEYVRTTKVEYAPHPYTWMRNARSHSRSTGLGLHTENLELPLDQLPPIDDHKIKILPMVWKNPITGRLALQVHPSAFRKLHLANGTVIDDLHEVRDILYRLQRPGIAPDLVYAHDWEEGDLVIFQ
ncbi:MAG: hypothetical protein M1820_002841 [Bogoriella megaspora]|nr:MAG: hypothetical protein M1820_002841 [Bogoriella megaspora]